MAIIHLKQIKLISVYGFFATCSIFLWHFFSLLFLSFLALYFAVYFGFAAYFGLDSNFSTKYSKVYSGYNFSSIIHQGCFERESHWQNNNKTEVQRKKCVYFLVCVGFIQNTYADRLHVSVYGYLCQCVFSS